MEDTSNTRNLCLTGSGEAGRSFGETAEAWAEVGERGAGP